MPTINQLVRAGRTPKKTKTKAKAQNKTTNTEMCYLSGFCTVEIIKQTVLH